MFSKYLANLDVKVCSSVVSVSYHSVLSNLIHRKWLLYHICFITSFISWLAARAQSADFYFPDAGGGLAFCVCLLCQQHRCRNHLSHCYCCLSCCCSQNRRFDDGAIAALWWGGRRGCWGRERRAGAGRLDRLVDFLEHSWCSPLSPADCHRHSDCYELVVNRT